MNKAFQTIVVVACVALLGEGALAADSGDVFSGRRRDSNAGPTVITSDKLEFDYKEFIALFDGNVVVNDPEFMLKADKMLVFFENTNEVKRVDAVGNVFLRSGDMTAHCGKAIYTSNNAQVFIQNDNPLVTKGENRIAGEKMSIWLREQRVVVESDVKLETQPSTLNTKTE